MHPTLATGPPFRQDVLSDEQRQLCRDAIETRGAALQARLLRNDQPVPYLHVFALLLRSYQGRVTEGRRRHLGLSPTRWLSLVLGLLWVIFGCVLVSWDVTLNL